MNTDPSDGNGMLLLFKRAAGRCEAAKGAHRFHSRRVRTKIRGEGPLQPQERSAGGRQAGWQHGSTVPEGGAVFLFYHTPARIARTTKEDLSHA